MIEQHCLIFGDPSYSNNPFENMKHSLSFAFFSRHAFAEIHNPRNESLAFTSPGALKDVNGQIAQQKRHVERNQSSTREACLHDSRAFVNLEC